MYSPKIAEELIPVLYHTAKQRCVPMTKLVNQLISSALSCEDISQLPATVAARATQPTAQR
jgi:hypothetical protein